MAYASNITPKVVEEPLSPMTDLLSSRTISYCDTDLLGGEVDNASKDSVPQTSERL